MPTRMDVSLDQLRALDALATHGTIARAAASLGRRPSAAVYALGQLEAQSGLVLLDRSGYRTTLTPAGERVLAEARRVLDGYDAVRTLCHTLRTGWEPSLRIVVDGIYPSRTVLRQVQALRAAGAPTQLEVSVEYLAGVEQAFEARRADLMISVLPPRDAALIGRPLPALPAHLVAAADHPLTRSRRVTREELLAHPLITVHGSDPRLELSTASLEQRPSLLLQDFSSKREALLAGLGFGWMPEYVIADDLRSGALARVPFDGGARHVFHPRLYARGGRADGRAAKVLLAGLRKADDAGDEAAATQHAAVHGNGTRQRRRNAARSRSS